ncbi:universal stress protein [Shewanella schlegeliana]|uniref:Universal stress protein n=1 Tax=Shewanella schlegeliana TaxID=190308 RepID=A0ABS1T1I6_9GAMM|nr:universal stress protein [Shewanella schlegeliana]MBL4913401.1 universal stress protein [Shewanella schlegeliana]MCL1108290.1 universal stress protein [Shewanella schlegeliana]GIU34574.1 universal stress protein A [Shewanella schlegeliana]
MRTRQILCPTDFSETASHAMSYAFEMAHFYKVGVRLLHVVDKPFGDRNTRVLSMTPEELAARMEKPAAEKMQQLIATLEQEVEIEGVIRHGHAAEQILATAKSMNAGMIVMASHGRTGLDHFLHANIAEQVANKATCPVLVVK